MQAQNKLLFESLLLSTALTPLFFFFFPAKILKNLMSRLLKNNAIQRGQKLYQQPFFFSFDPFHFGLFFFFFCFVLRGRKTSLFLLRGQMLVGVSGFFGPALICISANLWNGLARLFWHLRWQNTEWLWAQVVTTQSCLFFFFFFFTQREATHFSCWPHLHSGITAAKKTKTCRILVQKLCDL